MNMEALACNICKEPAWNFMCMDCVSKDIDAFLPAQLKPRFQEFHKGFSTHFDSSMLILNGSVHCMKCKSTKESPICPQCYSNEAYNWIDDHDPSLARKFFTMFSFGGPPESAVDRDMKPEEEFGICDECGEYTEELVQTEGEWVCHDCTLNQEE